MPKPTIQTVRQSLRLARGLISGAAISLEHVIANNEGDRPGDPITAEIAMQMSLDQSADFILGELEHAIAQIRKAQAITAELNTPVVEPVADVARAA